LINDGALQQEDGGLGVTFVEGNTDSGVEIQSISELMGHSGKVCSAFHINEMKKKHTYALCRLCSSKVCCAVCRKAA